MPWQVALKWDKAFQGRADASGRAKPRPFRKWERLNDLRCFVVVLQTWLEAVAGVHVQADRAL